jgi:pimeloyl-ACP methyl ester carboxylesterase
MSGSHTVYYDEFGQGPPIVFVTGLSGTRFGWWKQIEPFSQKYHVITLDNRDAGDSALGTGPYSIADMADDTAALITQLKLGPAFVVGISMGGFISLELALRHPELVQKLVLTSTSGQVNSHQPSSQAAAILFSRTEGESVAARTRRVYTILAGPGYMEAHPEDLEHIVGIAEKKPMSLESYQRQLGAIMMWQGVGDRFAQITMPSLVIHGDADPLVPCSNGQHLAEHLPNAKLLIYPGVGHLPTIEAAERYNRDVGEFLSAG